MTSPESDLEARLLYRATRVVEAHGKEQLLTNTITRDMVTARHWMHRIDHRSIHVILWKSGTLEVRITPSNRLHGGGIAYRNADGQTRFDPALSAVALEVIDKLMVLDDLAGI
jgi:hypothetical protein